ncbi:MAG: lipoyl synthase [Candidatus Schekmanbacteria bacterium]|nr:lipoyl synthase [Candidatus Schekmanbacteria bacterium]
MKDKGQRLPSWLVKKTVPGAQVHQMKALLRQARLHTVCESARCPNLGECFSKDTATFLIMGNICTRGCGFCAVDKGTPQALDPDEPLQVAQVSHKLELRHVVITSVTRDDLPDGGAAHFTATIQAVRELLPEALVEILTPDFGGDLKAITQIAKAAPDIFNHNLETVPQLYSRVRSQADYRRSLEVLAQIKSLNPQIRTKSGLMLGLGETKDQVEQVMLDLHRMACDLLVIGQYLRPTLKNLEVERYLTPQEFEEYRELGLKLGFRQVMSQPLARSSYHAGEVAQMG